MKTGGRRIIGPVYKQFTKLKRLFYRATEIILSTGHFTGIRVIISIKLYTFLAKAPRSKARKGGESSLFLISLIPINRHQVNARFIYPNFVSR